MTLLFGLFTERVQMLQTLTWVKFNKQQEGGEGGREFVTCHKWQVRMPLLTHNNSGWNCKRFLDHLDIR